MKYKNPSIVEALCEFTFAPETPWDSTIFGRLYERLKENFPQREEGEMLTATPTMSLQPTQAPAPPQTAVIAKCSPTVRGYRNWYTASD